jgi:exonuclease 1
MYKTGRA